MTDDVNDRIGLVDMDGTLADYDGAMSAAEALLRGPDEPSYQGRHDDAPPHIKARRDLIKRIPGFWRKLHRIPLGFEVVDEMRRIGFELHVLTRGPTGATNAWTEKLEWCQEHLPDAEVTIGRKKSLVYGRVLVDDWPPYFLSWLEVRPRGLVVAVAQPWNANVTHPNLLRYDGTNREELRRALQDAYDRPAAGR